MHTSRFTLHASSLAEVMASMRCWLDEHRVQPLIFACEETDGGRLVIKLAFALGAEAEAFAAVFKPPAGLRHEHSTAAVPASMPIGVSRQAGLPATAAQTAREDEDLRDPRTSPDDDPSKSDFPPSVDAACD